ncbi:MAG: M1 family metallopeptidase [Nitrospiraceae bacterium]
MTRRQALTSIAAAAQALIGLRYLASTAPAPAQGADAPIVLITRKAPGENMKPKPLPSRAMNPYRLPQHVIPTRYDLRLEPDLTAFTFTGAETVTLTITEPTSEIVFNAVDLQILEAVIENDARASALGIIELETSTERCRLRFPNPLQPGTWRLTLAFRGTLNDKLRGFYRSTYHDLSGKEHTLAATQFEATDARRCFPCWDEPAFKAVFSATLAIDPAFTAVSNTAVVSEQLEGGKKILRFADTIRMSTYLVAFVVGALEASEPIAVGGTSLRVWGVPGKRHLSSFGQEIGAFSLRFFEEYYGIPYPGEKLDLLAIPDFASGAMENLGAITFRETALLVDQWTATHAELERVADVVAHENAHMWFGDLVTMSWWNGLWLNEAFATFMEMLAIDAWKPEWERWAAFGVSRAAAMGVDGLHSTRPIEYPVEAPKDAEAMFDVLTYEKGASVLRMLEQHIGPEVFRDGVREYLRAHAYGNADTGDLWIALGHAAKQPVPAVMNGWIFKPGYPLLTATLNRDRLVVTQQRFTYLSKPLKGSSSKTSQRWQVPIQIRIVSPGKTESRRVLLTDKDTQIALPKDFESVLLNEGGHGFYRVRYAPDLLARLVAHLSDLTPIDRFNLVNDAWAATVAGVMPLADYLELTANFRAERDKNVWATLLDSFHALHRIITPADRPKLEALVRDRVGPAATALGWEPLAGESELTKQLRADLIRALGVMGNDPQIQARVAELYVEHLRDGAVSGTPGLDPNLMPAIIAIQAFTGDQRRYDEFFQKFRSAATPQEERRYLYSLTTFRPAPLIDQTLARTINGDIRTQDAPFLVSALLGSVYGRERAWEFVKQNWDTMDRLFPKSGLRRMCGGIVGLVTPELEHDVRRFFEERKIDLGGKTLAQYLEQLHIGVTLRRRETKTLNKYLERFKVK